MEHTVSLEEGLAACDRLLATLTRVLTLEARASLPSSDLLAPPLTLYALSQVRMRLRPALTASWLEQDPVHVSLFGGSNSGKSTLLNVLLGRAAAGMHVTARFSQYPEAYRPAALGSRWLDAFPSRFAGYRRYENQHPPRQTETLLEAKYCPAIAVLDPERTAAAAQLPAVTQTAVLWDAPDFSTAEAQAYFGAVLDLIALADIVILAVTDESYADDRTVMLFRMVSESGVALHAVVNKLDAGVDLVEDIKQTLNRNWRGPTPQLPLTSFHQLPTVTGTTPEQRLHLLLATHAAEEFRASIAEEIARGPVLKRQTLAGAVRFLERHLEDVLHVLVAEVEEAHVWQDTVKRTFTKEFLDRYHTDYLYGQQYGEFNQALVRLLALVEAPGLGGVMRFVTEFMRAPFRLVTGFLGFSQSESDKVDAARSAEWTTVTQLFSQWIAALKAEAQTFTHTRPHPAWPQVVHALSEDLEARMLRDFAQHYAAYRQEIDKEVQQRSQDLYDAIAQRPALLQGLRGVNVAADAATILLVVKSAGIDWSDAVISPLLAGCRRILLEAGMGAYLETQKRLLRQHQLTMFAQLVRKEGIQPLEHLFPARDSANDLDRARRDFAIVKDALLHIV